MGYFHELADFETRYKLGAGDRLKLRFLYPLFKMHFWFYYARGVRQRLAKAFFAVARHLGSVSVRCHSETRGARFELPIWFVPDNLTSLREIFWYQGYQPEAGWAPSSVVDAGANIGYASLFFATKFPLKKILAIEANPQLLPKLERIQGVIKALGVDFRIANGALVGVPRSLTFGIHENSRDSSFEDAGGDERESLTVRGLRLDDWLAQLGFAKADFKERRLTKIDVEGAEFEVLEKDSEFFADSTYLIAEIHGEKPKRDTFVRQLPAGFTILKRSVSPACLTAEVLYANR